MKILKWILSICALFTGVYGGELLTVNLVSRAELEATLRATPSGNHERQETLARMLSEAGCADHVAQVPVAHWKAANVVCTLPGTSAKRIIAGAHFDHVTQGMGIIDNWAGASLLPRLLIALRSQPRVHTYQFVGFAEEETGLNGSTAFVKGISKAERPNVQAMVNIDSIGLDTTAVWARRADRHLAQLAFTLAASLKIPLDAVNVDNVGESDSRPFENAKIPVIDFHSIHPGEFEVLHSVRDNFGAVRMSEYENTYKLLANYLAWLDTQLKTGDAGQQ